MQDHAERPFSFKPIFLLLLFCITYKRKKGHSALIKFCHIISKLCFRFRSDPNGLLIATDVAARGLDIPNVDHVIHYQVPRTAEVIQYEIS